MKISSFCATLRSLPLTRIPGVGSIVPMLLYTYTAVYPGTEYSGNMLIFLRTYFVTVAWFRRSSVVAVHMRV